MKQTRRAANAGPTLDDGVVVELPAALSADVAAEAARVMARAEAMGLIEVVEGHALDSSLLHTALDALLRAGIGRQLVQVDDAAGNSRGALELLNQSIEACAYPKTEWSSVSDILGIELLTALVGVSPSSVKRYATGERETPDLAAARLHFLAMLIADLLGSYNRYGVRRWFERPRKPLGGQSPREALGPHWQPDDPAAQRIADLAQALTSLGAT